MVRLHSQVIYAFVQVIAVTVLTNHRCATQHSNPGIKLSLGPENRFLPSETARFNCTVENAQLYTVSLLQHQTCLTFNLHSLEAGLSITSSQDSFIFEISNIREENDATYRCCVVEKPNVCKDRFCSSYKRLEVYPPPADPVCSRQVPTDVYIGQELHITCVAGKSRPDPTVYWKITPDGDELPADPTEQDDTTRHNATVIVSRVLNGKNLTCTLIWAVPKKRPAPPRIRECHLGPFSVQLPPTTTIPQSTEHTPQVDIKTTNRVVSMHNSTGLIQTGHVTEIMEFTTEINTTELYMYTSSIQQKNMVTAKNITETTLPDGHLELALIIGLSLLIFILVLIIVLLIRKMWVTRRKKREAPRDYWAQKDCMSIKGNRSSVYSNNSTDSSPPGFVILHPRQQLPPVEEETESSFKSNTLRSIPESATYVPPHQIRHTYLRPEYTDDCYPTEIFEDDDIDFRNHPYSPTDSPISHSLQGANCNYMSMTRGMRPSEFPSYFEVVPNHEYHGEMYARPMYSNVPSEQRLNSTEDIYY